MAIITPVVVAESVTAAAFSATAAGGDLISCPSVGDGYLIEFRNDAAGAVTFTIPAAITTQNLAGVGVVTKGNLSQSVPAGGERTVFITSRLLTQYLNGASQIPITYTSPDVLFKVRALRIPNN